MKIFKKRAALFAASALALTFAGCNNSQESGENGNSGGSGNSTFKTVDQIKDSGQVYMPPGEIMFAQCPPGRRIPSPALYRRLPI